MAHSEIQTHSDVCHKTRKFVKKFKKCENIVRLSISAAKTIFRNLKELINSAPLLSNSVWGFRDVPSCFIWA